MNEFLLPNISNEPRKAEPVMVYAPEMKETSEKEREQNREKFYQAAGKFYGLIIAPLEEDIKTDKLIIVPHGVLHKVPFSTLTDGNEYLVDKYALSVLPSSSIMEFVVKKRKPERDSLLAFGNPIADYVPGFRELEYAEAEVSEIGRHFEKKEIYTREEATETMARERSSWPNVIHFASHGEFNECQPLQSGLLLTKDRENDGRLMVHETFGLDLRKADLVTLSACETGLSKIEGGDDLVGLSRGFIYAGTPSLLATLWEVDDLATARLMGYFYQNYQKGMSKPEALRQAQIALKNIPEYKHPYYWAPFLMIGDWK